MSGEWLAVALLCVAGWWWWDGLQKREAAVRAARTACARIEAQLLDETVALRRMRLRRDENQQMRIYREFAFEYTVSGNDRMPGRARLLGQRLLGVELIELGE